MPLFSLPANLPPIGRHFFDNNQSVLLFNGTGDINASAGVQITPLKEYAQREFPAFASAYDNSSILPPLFILDPPQKGRLSLNCLDSIENALHLNFENQNDGEVLLAFNQPVAMAKNQYIDLQLSRRSSCWFLSHQPSICAQPRDMIIDIQLQNAYRFYPRSDNNDEKPIQLTVCPL